MFYTKKNLQQLSIIYFDSIKTSLQQNSTIFAVWCLEKHILTDKEQNENLYLKPDTIIHIYYHFGEEQSTSASLKIEFIEILEKVRDKKLKDLGIK